MRFNAIKNCIKGLWVKHTHSQKKHTYSLQYYCENFPAKCRYYINDLASTDEGIDSTI